MITPSAPPSGTSTSDVTANDLFLISTTLFSDSRPIPANNNWLLPLISEGRPADVGLMRSICRSSSGSTLYLTASINQRRCNSCSLSGSSFERSLDCVQSVLPSYSSHTSSSKAGITAPPISHGVRCLVTALQPL